MKMIKIDFRKFPEKPTIESNFELTELQKKALISLPPVVDILNLDVKINGEQIFIENATCQYYDNQEHKFSKKIPMIYNEIEDIINRPANSWVMSVLINNLSENG